MTAEEKRDRRKARHELRKAFNKMLRTPSRSGLTAGFVYTKPQMKAATKTLTDRFLREQVNAAVEKIEREVSEQQGEEVCDYCPDTPCPVHDSEHA